MDNLSWQSNPLQFVEQGKRPVFFHVWEDEGRIADELEELKEKIEFIPTTVKEKLTTIKSIVAIELGIIQIRTMNEVIAFEIAYWLSESKSGVILDYNDNWYDHDKNRWTPISI